MEHKTRRIIGWSFSALPLLFLLMGAFPKFTANYQTMFETAYPAFAPAWVFGLVLILAVVLYLVPKTQVIGFVLASSYLGGAAALAWQTTAQTVPAGAPYGIMAALMVFVAITLLWIGQAFLRPSLLQRSDN